ncbi:unnamed protein product [Trichobilharzia regenti]|nr:unnamed protein product [Trichobilharzia regenti]
MTRCTRGGSCDPSGLVDNALAFESMDTGLEPRWEYYHSLGNADLIKLNSNIHNFTNKHYNTYKPIIVFGLQGTKTVHLNCAISHNSSNINNNNSINNKVEK